MQPIQQKATRWLCPECGEVSAYSLHPEKVPQRKKIGIKPIFPVCAACDAELYLSSSPTPRPDTRLIVLTGTCASGKSTTAEALIARHGFYGIDGNCVMDVIAFRSGLKRIAFNGVEMLQEIALEIDILLALQQDIVLSHVVIPEDLPAYREMFRRRGLQYRIFVLQPRYSMAVSRSQARRNHPTLTAEEWVKHFHDAMGGFIPEDDVVIVDNSDLSVEESAESILRTLSVPGYNIDPLPPSR